MKHFIFGIVLLFAFVMTTEAQSSRADRYRGFQDIVRTVRALARFREPSLTRNTFYISDVNKDEWGREFAYALWPEDNSITILQLPIYSKEITKNSPEHWWLITKARIDLKKDVVATQNDIHGSSFLVSRPWVNGIKRRCLNGVRLRI